MWQCEMCSHHKPGESYYCVLVLSKHAAACFVGDSHSLLFVVVDALAGAVVLRWTDSGPAAVQEYRRPVPLQKDVDRLFVLVYA